MGLASVFGGTGADAIDLGGVGSARGLYVVPGAGDDSVVLGLGNDTVIPGGGADTAVGGSGTDVILLAQGAAETTYSSLVSYNPFLVSGTPATMLVIDLSNVASAQTVSSGATLRFADTSFEVVDATGQLNSNVDLALVGNGAANTLIGGAGDDYIRSMTTANNDDANGNVLAGGNGADYLRSGSGSDTLYGGSVSGLALSVDSIGTGDNVFFSHLFSSSVADSLRSGATFDYANIYEGRGGNDVMIASSGKDIFFYQGTASQGSDTIYNFKVGEDYLFLVSQSSFPNGTDVVFFGDTVGANRDVGTAQTAFLASDSVTGTFAVDGVNVTVSIPTVAWSYEAVVGQVGMYTVKFDPDGSGANPGFTITLVGVDGTITSINSLFPPGKKKKKKT